MKKETRIKATELKQKIAQLICPEVRFPKLINHPERLSRLKKQLKKYQWGSIIVFEAEANRGRQLIAELQECVTTPLLVCSDLERGAGQHFSGATIIPSNMAMAATGDEKLAYEAGKTTAREARQLGVNVIFAPTLDINSNPDNPIINSRSFGSEPDIVSKFGLSFIKGCQSEKVIATAKHFPGHGATSEDSHIALPVISKSLKKLKKEDLLPFINAVKNDVKAIMTAHIAFPHLDQSNSPATLSEPIIKGLLRRELGFKGLIFTDAMIMSGAETGKKSGLSPELRAILAGCDILLMPSSPVKTLEEIYRAVRTGQVPLQRIEEACRRIIDFKQKYCLPVKPEPKLIACEKHLTLAARIASRAITCHCSQLSQPLKPKRLSHLIIDMDDNPTNWNNMAQQLESKYHISSFALGSKVKKRELTKLQKQIKEKDIVLISFFSQFRAWKKKLYPDPEVFDFLMQLIKEKEVIIITYSNPYLIRKLAGIKNYFCTFSDSEASQQEIIKVLFEGKKATGKSPVKF